MAIKRVQAEKDTTITNARRSSLVSSGSLANMGAADVLEIFSIYGQTSDTGSNELARVLVKFPLDEISSSMSNGDMPQSAEFYLKLFNARHAETLPKQFYIEIKPVSSSWTEGTGLDLDEYEDLGAANWLSSSEGVAWVSPGGDYITDHTSTAYFDKGFENLEVNVSTTVRSWLSGTLANNGFGLMLSSSLESGEESYFTKKFFARSSEYFFLRPVLEARWDSSICDDRTNAYESSSLMDSDDNLNHLYFYNNIKGNLKNIPSIGTGELNVAIYSSASNGVPLPSSFITAVTGGYVSRGIYSASVAVARTGSHYDVWYSGSIDENGVINGLVFYTGAFELKSCFEHADTKSTGYVVSIVNGRQSYYTSEVPEFRFFFREKNWNPNIYGVSRSILSSAIIEETFFKISRVSDDYEVVPYGTGSTKHTKLSYDDGGHYFEFEMNMLEPGYMYEITLGSKINNDFIEHPYRFKFKVKDRHE